MQIFLFFGIAIAVLAVIFAVQNNQQVTISFLAWEGQGSLALVLLIALAVGAAISFLLSLPANVKARWTIRNQRKKMTQLESDLEGQKQQVGELQKKLEPPKPEEKLPLEAEKEKAR
jgi:lipopolysaccharide assembly protein A